VETDPETPLLYVLRDDLQLNGPKFGCGLGQCGYCINGMIMTTKALLDKTPKPNDAQIKEALAGNLCRCGTHIRIVRAVKRASGQQV
jgi:aerobic-type carbon monoxide dehydrogenase small subunit (CoxS/CutS family)